MDGLTKMQDDLEQAIDKYENKSYTSEKKDPVVPHPETLRDRLDQLIHSHKFMVSVIVLVVLDCVMVIAVLLFDLEIVELGEDHHYVPKIFHYTSLGILCIFLIEIGLRLYVLRLSFFKHKLEVFDAFIVIISFILDIVFRDSEDATTGTGLLILLRLWRVTRILNGIILSIKKQAEEQVENERHLRSICEENIKKYQTYTEALEAEMTQLQDKLKQHGIDFTVGEKPKLNLTEMPQSQSSHKSK